MIGFVSTGVDQATAAADGERPWALCAGRLEEPALGRGWKLAILTLFFAGYLLQYPLLVLIGLFAILFRYASHWYSQRALQGITFQRRFGYSRTFPDEETTLVVRVANRKRLPLSWLTVVDHWSDALALSTLAGDPLPGRPADLVTLQFSIRGQEQISRTYRVRPEKRGIYPFGPVAVSSGDPFGLFIHQSRNRQRDLLVVYPHIVPLEELALPYQAPFGELSVSRSIFQDPVRTVGVRDYRPEDSMRHVHWKASARSQDLKVRIFEPTTSYTMVLVLNVATFARHWEGTRPDILERVVSATASIANYGVQRRWLVGLTANGAMPGADQPIRVPPARGPDQLSFLLEALAGVTSFTTFSFDRFLLAESRRVAWGATLVIVTAVVSDEIMASLSRLRAAGRRVVLVALTAEPPQPPPGMLAYYSPNEGLAFEPGQTPGKARLVPIVSGPTSPPSPASSRPSRSMARAVA